MREPDPSAIHNQVDFSTGNPLRLQPLPGNRFIPFTNLDSWIVQKTTEPLHYTRQLGLPRNLPCDPAQVHRTALMNADHQPNKVSHLGDSLFRTQFTNLLNPCMIEAVDRHFVTPCIKWFQINQFYWR